MLTEERRDHRLNDFPGYEHPEWLYKRVQTAKIDAALRGKTKVINVITGLFLGYIFLPGRTSPVCSPISHG